MVTAMVMWKSLTGNDGEVITQRSSVNTPLPCFLTTSAYSSLLRPRPILKFAFSSLPALVGKEVDRISGMAGGNDERLVAGASLFWLHQAR
jgi:hypothetical protein